MIDELSDERRAQKPWLPQDGTGDIANGLVYEDAYGKPACTWHGAMNRVHPVERIYRCSEQRCGVGARVGEAKT